MSEVPLYLDNDEEVEEVEGHERDRLDERDLGVEEHCHQEQHRRQEERHVTLHLPTMQMSTEVRSSGLFYKSGRFVVQMKRHEEQHRRQKCAAVLRRARI